MKILVVEDDDLLNKTLCFNLNAAGYAVESAMSFTSANILIAQHVYDLVILDIGLPDGNGFDLCREIKTLLPHVAVIFLTAQDMESDMLRGFELGADDYVTKPFPISVFQRKVSALLSRISKQICDDCYSDENLSINFTEMTASLFGESITFTPMEYRMLKILVNNPQTVLTRQALLDKLWDANENFVEEHTLTSLISRIRVKIESNEVQYIKTVYGMGYMWIGGMKK